jgi:hypothetical protein
MKLALAMQRNGQTAGALDTPLRRARHQIWRLPLPMGSRVNVNPLYTHHMLDVWAGAGNVQSLALYR